MYFNDDGNNILGQTIVQIVSNVQGFAYNSEVEKDANAITTTDNRLDGCALFSCFTADIIKQETLFTR